MVVSVAATADSKRCAVLIGPFWSADAFGFCEEGLLSIESQALTRTINHVLDLLRHKVPLSVLPFTELDHPHFTDIEGIPYC